MIVAPSSQQGDKFTAVGAGPFTEDVFTPSVERIFKANPSYYGGAPKLDKLRMVALNGPQANLESLNSGQLDVATFAASRRRSILPSPLVTPATSTCSMPAVRDRQQP